MLKPFAALAALGIFCAMAFAQNKPPTYRLWGGNNAEWKGPGYSLDEVRSAVLKTFEGMDWKVLDMTNDPWTVSATKNLPADFDPSKRPHLAAIVAMKAGDAAIMASFYIGHKGQGKSVIAEAKQFYDEFFAKVAEALK
jgi:hypothetical protein